MSTPCVYACVCASVGKRYTFRPRDTDADGSIGEASARLVRDLGNIRSIVNHFCPRIKSWQTANQIAVLTPQQVLDVVQKNYETLNLKLMVCTNCSSSLSFVV